MAGVKVSRATVFYIVTPTPFSASIFEQCIHALRTLSPRPQFVPLVASSAGELEALFGPAPVGQVNRATQLLIGLFNRLLITIDRLRLKPAAMDEIRWTDSRTYVNACGLPLSFTLPSPSPSRFNFKWPSPQTNILEHDRVLHAAFATSLDRSWLALAIMDDRNEEQTFRCHSLGPPLSSATTEAEQRARTTRVVEVVVRTTMERASMVKIEWTVGFWCVGAMRADEVQSVFYPDLLLSCFVD